MSSVAASRARDELSSNILPLISSKITTCLLPEIVLTYLVEREGGEVGREVGR